MPSKNVKHPYIFTELGVKRSKSPELVKLVLHEVVCCIQYTPNKIVCYILSVIALLSNVKKYAVCERDKGAWRPRILSTVIVLVYTIRTKVCDILLLV